MQEDLALFERRQVVLVRVDAVAAHGVGLLAAPDALQREEHDHAALRVLGAHGFHFGLARRLGRVAEVDPVEVDEPAGLVGLREHLQLALHAVRLLHAPDEQEPVGVRRGRAEARGGGAGECHGRGRYA